MLAGPAIAQVNTHNPDPFAPRIDPFEQRVDPFAPRTYGSTEVAPINYGHVQSQTVRVVEPVTQDFQTTIFAAPTYTEGDVVRAQHFKPGDLSDAEYQALLDEADRIRAYQVSNGYVSESYTDSQNSYVSNNSADTGYDAGTTTVYSSTNGSEIELFAPESVDTGAVTYAETTPIAAPTFNTAPTQTHNVLRGDTLYNISKRYSVSVESVKSANYMTNNDIGIGQVLTIPPSTKIISENSYIAPVTTVSSNANLTYIRNVEPISQASSGIYAVLPQDTLYSISRRTCVKVSDLIAVNGISSPNAIQPGQRLTMPQGHCLN